MYIDEVRNCKNINKEVFEAAIKSGLTFVKAQNVSDYYMMGTNQENFNVWDDFPNIVPPWKSSWAEWKTATHSNNNGKRVPLPGPFKSGVLIA